MADRRTDYRFDFGRVVVVFGLVVLRGVVVGFLGTARAVLGTVVVETAEFGADAVVVAAAA